MPLPSPSTSRFSSTHSVPQVVAKNLKPTASSTMVSSKKAKFKPTDSYKKAKPTVPSKKKSTVKTHMMKKPAAVAVAYRHVDVPPQQRAQLDSWGPTLLQTVRASFMKYHESSGSSGVQTCALFAQGATPVRIGTDCSGAESPIWALRSVGVPHEHIFSCDWKAPVREFIRATCPPTGPIFDDMLKRNNADIPQIDMYVAGFPCTPFSSLRGHATKLLREKAAKVFFKCLRVIASKLPPVAILENVMGIVKVMDRVAKELQKLKSYFVLVIPIDSKDLGEPVARPRYYFILVRRDTALLSDERALAKLADCVRKATMTEVTDHIVDRMLPNSCAEVQKFLSGCEAKMVSRGSGVRKSNLKWVEKHAKFRLAHGLPAHGVSSQGSAMSGLSVDRQRDAWDTVCHLHKGGDTITDLSQNLDRAHVHTTGVCPTVTPHGVICVGRAHRIMMPIEKLLVHGFPLHRMNIPASTSEAALASLGGNAMHVKSVGLALLIGLCLVRGPLPARAADKVALAGLGGAPSAIFLDRLPAKKQDATKQKKVVAKGALKKVVTKGAKKQKLKQKKVVAKGAKKQKLKQGTTK
jgi:site-specific DNA-cytosine methylase